MSPLIQTVLLLTASNIFMTFAWYGHLKHFKSSALYIAIAVSWGIALFEYMLMVPANRIGHQVLCLGSAENFAGSDYLKCVYSICRALYERAL